MEPRELIESFARAMDLESPVFDETATCRLEFGDGTSLRCNIAAKQELLVTATLCNLSGSQADQEVKRLLQVNLGRAATRREVVSADPQNGDIVLFSRLRTADMEPREFEGAMEEFLNSLDFWTANFAGGAQAAPLSPFSMVRP